MSTETDADVAGVIRGRITRSVDDVLECVDTFRGLAKQLETAAELQVGADPEALRGAAVVLSAVGAQALLGASLALRVAERVTVLASIREVMSEADSPSD